MKIKKNNKCSADHKLSANCPSIKIAIIKGGCEDAIHSNDGNLKVLARAFLDVYIVNNQFANNQRSRLTKIVLNMHFETPHCLRYLPPNTKKRRHKNTM